MKASKSILKVFYKAAAILFLFCAGIVTGLYIAQQEAYKESAKLTVDTIGVVNMDMGVAADSGYVNYASELMRYPDVNFVSMGLEEARQGVESGRYAAYILIPASFSESVVSINTVPGSAGIEYAVNPDLRDDVYEKVQEDITGFIENLNNNIEYMYLASILSEFHGVQDAAGQIMANDTADMNLLLEIGYEEIGSRITLSAIEMPEYNITPLSLDEYYQRMEAAADEIALLYAAYESSGEQAFAGIMQNGADMSEELTAAGNLMRNADISKDAAGNDLLASGIQNINAYAGALNAENAAAVSAIEGEIASLRQRTVQELADLLRGKVVRALENEVDQYYAEQIQKLSGYIAELEEMTGTLSQAADDMAQGNVPGNGNVVDYTGIQEQLAVIAQEMEALKANTFTIDETEINGVTEEFAEEISSDVWTILDLMEAFRYPDGEEMQALVSDSLVVPVQANQARIMGEIDHALSSAYSSMTAYQEQVQGFHMYDYVNEEEIRTELSVIQENIAAICTEVAKQDAGYRDLVYEIYAAENETLQSWQNEIMEADALSAQRLEEGLEAAKISRSASNSSNVDVLYALTQKLPYTRMGSMEYTNAYEFIVSPVTVSDVGEERKTAVFTSARDYGSYMAGAAVCLAVICLVKIGHYAFGRRGNWKIRRENGEPA